jgi:nitrogen fixation/metabolism regulation signal transduction histidine kinase
MTVSGYFIIHSVDRSNYWLEVASPERTINSLRLTEARLQEIALEYLIIAGEGDVLSADTLLDWRIVIEGGHVIEASASFDFNESVDSAFRDGAFDPGPVRWIIGRNLIVGASIQHGDSLLAGGFTFNGEYLSGFEAASSTMRESRRSRVLKPGLVLFLTAVGATLLLMIIILSYWLSRRLSVSVTTPLEQLTAVTAAIARGDKPHKISMTGTEEIARLTETFNRMIFDLEESRKRLVAVERVAAWQEFARRLAHELKNPLTPISLSLYRLRNNLEKSGDYDRFADSIEAISAEVTHLQRLAEDYSSLAKLPEPEPAEFDLAVLAQEVIQLYAAQLETYSFHQKIPGAPVIIKADPNHLRQVIVNLIKNAIEFTSANKKISISLIDAGETVTFMVANEGKNVNESDLQAAKLPYFSTRKGGLGLGLAISEKIIIDHGGSLSLELSDGMTIARFTIPKGDYTG